MTDAALGIGLALIALGLCAAPAWLAIVGAGRRRRRTPGGGLAITAAALLTPAALCMVAAACLTGWIALSRNGMINWPPHGLTEIVERAFPFAAALFPAGLALVALAARAALVAAARGPGDETGEEEPP